MKVNMFLKYLFICCVNVTQCQIVPNRIEFIDILQNISDIFDILYENDITTHKEIYIMLYVSTSNGFNALEILLTLRSSISYLQ